MTLKELWEKVWPGVKTAGEHIVGYFVIDEVIDQVTGKTRRVLDVDKLRKEAPFMVQGLEDEKRFNLLITELNSGEQKSLEIWMANLGPNQRADVILTIATMYDTDKASALSYLKQMAAISPDMFKTRRAVAFRLCKSSEDEYFYSKLSKEAQRVLADAWQEFKQGKADWDAWMRATAVEIDAETQEIRQARLDRQLVREHGTWWERFHQSRRRLTSLPWERD